MAAKEFNDWVKGDVAIEIISKMIASESEELDRILDEFEKKGFDEDSMVVQNNKLYQSIIQNISGYNSEIQEIYNGENLDSIYDKVSSVYASLVRKLYSQNFQDRKLIRNNSILITITKNQRIRRRDVVIYKSVILINSNAKYKRRIFKSLKIMSPFYKLNKVVDDVKESLRR